jgi:hypothetical protein
MHLRFYFLFSILISLGCTNAQDLNTSPFSRYGLGELNSVLSTHFLGMSNASSSFSDAQNINIANPASYSGFFRYNPIFDVSVSGKSALYKSNYLNEENSSSASNAGLNNMLIGLPIQKNWGLVLGILPYSSMGYNATANTTIDSNSVSYKYTGDGSINRLILGNGFNIINKGDSLRIALGFNASYLFGTLNQMNSVEFNDNSYYNSRIQNQASLSSWLFDGGIQYFQQFRNALNSNRWFLRMGATYSLQSNAKTINDYFAYTYTYNFNIQEIPKDTLSFQEDVEGSVSIPDKMSFSISVGRNAQDKNVWDLAVQYTSSDWTSFNDNQLFLNQANLSLGAFDQWALGYRITPSLDWANTNKSIFAKSNYSFGFKKATSEVILQEKSLINYGINFGVSIPMLSSRSLSRLNLGCEIGRLGGLVENNIEENYLRFSLGFSMAPDTRYDRWFRKRKYD